jgi:glucose-1-phosphate thymidylyltransferase
MNIIIPMAGRGSRLRPHTLTTPKPLISIAGKPIVQRLVEDIAAIVGDQLNQVAYVVGDFGAEVEKDLLDVATRLGGRGSIHYQEKALGTAHAVLCAAEALEGPVVVAFADTLFRADFRLDDKADGVIWVKSVEDPRAFGVIKLDEAGHITDFVEKPQEFVSDLAIIGIYYFKDGARLRRELQYLIDNNIQEKGEYQLTNALENMKRDGMVFVPGEVDDWMDCGNKDNTVDTAVRILGYVQTTEALHHPSAVVENSTLVPPVYLGPGAVVRNSTVGPGVCIGQGTTVENATLQHTVIQNNSVVSGVVLNRSMIGNHARLEGGFTSVSLGDYSQLDA